MDMPVTGERPGRDTAHITAHLRSRIRQFLRLALEITPGVLHGDLGPLVYTVEQNATFDQHVPPHVEDTPLNRELWQRYRRVHSNFEVCGQRLHLYPELVSADGHIDLCVECHTALRSGTVPKRCIAAGWDLGSSQRANLPQPSFLESLCLVRTRVPQSLLLFPAQHLLRLLQYKAR